MSRIASQSRILTDLAARLRGHWRGDPAFGDRLERLLSGDRRFGSRDRRLYRELVWAVVRHLPWVEPWLARDPGEFVRRAAWLAGETPATSAFRREAAAGLPPCPEGASDRAAVLGEDPGALDPAWFGAECSRAGDPGLRDCLLSRAPLWVRVQGSAGTDDAQAEAAATCEFEARGWAWKRSDQVAGAIRLQPDAALTTTAAYAAGLVEIQDAGSQRILAVAAPAPGGRWLDACAGAGGKALQLAALLGPDGRVEAQDIRESALRELQARALRAGLSGRIAVIRAPGNGYDGVLVDAPCSGSGTWRRSPHLKWTTTAAGVARAADVQVELLGRFGACVRPGGRLVYATCSLCRSENEGAAARFLEAHPDFVPEDLGGGVSGTAGRTLWPDEHDGDGYFVAAFRRSRGA